MDTRTRITRPPCKLNLNRVYRDWNVYSGAWNVTESNTTYDLTGSCGATQSITSERGGSFLPGVFRLNEVYIDKLHRPLRVLPTLRFSYQVGGTQWWQPNFVDTWTGDYNMYRLQPERALTSYGLPSLDADFLKKSSLLGAYAKMHSSSADLGTDLGELKETIAMLRSPFQSLRKALLNFKRLTKGKPVSVAADTWMELRYGIMPLVYSIQSYVAQGWRHYNQTGVLRRESATKRIGSVSVVDGPFVAFDKFYAQERRTITRTVKATTKVYFKYSRQVDYSYALGLDVTALPGLMWELTKMSWMLDWYLNVGTFLEAHRHDPYRSVLGHCTTVVAADEVTNDLIGSYAGKYVLTSDWQHTLTQSKVERVIGSPLPSFPVVDVGFNSIKHVVDALALSWQSMPKIIKK